MEKPEINNLPPCALERCRHCGGLAKLHHSRSRRWYVRCTACKGKNQTEESPSKLTICKVWNVRNKGEA